MMIFDYSEESPTGLFGQRTYAVPAVVAGAVRALPAIGNAIGIGATVKQGLDSSKVTEATLDNQKELHDLQMRLNEKRLKEQELRNQSLENSTPEQKTMSNPGSIWNWNNVKGFGKDVGTFVKQNKSGIYSSIAGGLVATGVSYGINKALQKDQERIYKKALDEERAKYNSRPNNIPNMQQKSYSTVWGNFMSGAKDVMTGVGSKIKDNLKPMPLLMTAGLGSGLVIAQHAMNRKAMTQMAKQSAQEKVANERQQQMQRLNQQRVRGTQPSQMQMRAYSFVNNVGGFFKGIGKSAVDKFNDFKKTPGQNLMGMASSFVGGYGKNAVKEGSAQFQNIGMKSGNAITQKVGNFLVNNPKTAIAATIPIGIGMAKLTSLPGKALKKGIQKVDKKAWSYGQHQEEEFGE